MVSGEFREARGLDVMGDSGGRHRQREIYLTRGHGAASSRARSNEGKSPFIAPPVTRAASAYPEDAVSARAGLGWRPPVVKRRQKRPFMNHSLH